MNDCEFEPQASHSDDTHQMTAISGHASILLRDHHLQRYLTIVSAWVTATDWLRKHPQLHRHVRVPIMLHDISLLNSVTQVLPGTTGHADPLALVIFARVPP